MGRLTTPGAVIRELKAADDIVILAHQSPDGDTIGSAFALMHALGALGKRVRVECSDPYPEVYRFLHDGYEPEQFNERLIISTDIATEQLFGEKLERYKGRVDIAIDHHPTNTRFAKRTLLVPAAAATCEIMYKVIRGLCDEIDAKTASCLYTGLATDTGCFKFSNTTPLSHEIAAKLMRYGADAAYINRHIFETKTRQRLELEMTALSSIKYYENGRIAVMYIPLDMLVSTGVSEEETDSISSLPRQIAGVEIGITVKQREGGEFKVSVRTGEQYDASEICKRFDGGGHKRAAGCLLRGTPETALNALVAAACAAKKLS